MTPNYSQILDGGKILPPMQPPVAADAVVGPSSQVNSVKPSRFTVLNRFIDESVRLLTNAEAATWFVLFRNVKPNGLACMAHSQIAEKLGCDRRTVARALKKLEAKGLITVVKRGGLNRGSNVYRVHATPRRVTPTPPSV